jgi:hypothetical protein
MVKEWVTTFASEIAADGIASASILADTDRLLPG